jgi:transposase-like protein/predicted RNA-binding Zn-ribbon protein involved in translation (DUF1610 family)
VVAANRPHPRAGVDYPGSWQAFLTWFPDDAACRAYLEQLRWAEGFICPACGHVKAWPTAAGRRMCAGCGRQTSVMAGTVFEKTRTPLPTWFAAAWYLTNQKQGASALGLQRVLGLGSYQTAWAMLHKLRRAMVRPDRDRLSGEVEVDETYVGGVEPGVSGRQTVTKAIVVIAVELHEPRGFGRIRLRQIPDVTSRSLVSFVRDVVAPGSGVHTDGWGSYLTLPKHGYRHHRTVLSASGDPAHVSMPAVHRVAALLKRWLLGTYQGSVAPEHLDAYLDEFTFRFNRRTARQRGLLFHRLMEQAVATAPAPSRSLRPQPNLNARARVWREVQPQAAGEAVGGSPGRPGCSLLTLAAAPQPPLPGGRA